MQRLAFTQDNEGIVDLAINKKYKVYGIRKNKFGTFFLVLTDQIHSDLPWWMPEIFFKITDTYMPTNWRKTSWRGYGKEEVYSHPSYFEVMEDIEDSTEIGHEVFAEMEY
jgi:hypothetical protein